MLLIRDVIKNGRFFTPSIVKTGSNLFKRIVFEPQGLNLYLPFKSQSLGDNNFVPTLLYFQPRKIGQFVG